MDSPIIKRLWLALRLLTSAGLLAWLILQFDWQQAWQAILSISPIIGLALLAGMSLNRLLAFTRFWVLLDQEGAGIPLHTTVRLSFLSVFASNFLPSTVGGDVTKIGWLATRGHSAWRATLWALFDRLSNMLAVGLLLPFCALLPLFRDPLARWLGGWALDSGSAMLISLLLGLATGAILGLFQPPSDGDRPPPDSTMVGSIARLRSLWESLLARKRTFGLLAVISLISVLPFLAGTWLTARDLGIEIGLGEVTAIYVVLYFVSLPPVSINGLGVQEVSTVYLYQSLGATQSEAVALAVLLRFVIWITTLPGALWLGRGVEGG